MVDFDRLEGLIRAQGKKKSHLCALVGKNRGYIADARNGNGSISEEALEVFARELGTTTAYLRGETDSSEPEEGAGLEKEALKLQVAAFWGGGEKLSQEEIDALWDDAEGYYKFKLQELRKGKRGQERS